MIRTEFLESHIVTKPYKETACVMIKKIRGRKYLFPHITDMPRKLNMNCALIYILSSVAVFFGHEEEQLPCDSIQTV